MWAVQVLIVTAAIALLWALHVLRVRELVLRERRFREAIDAMPAMAYIMMPDGTRTFLNQRLRDYTGLGADDHIPIAPVPVVHPDNVELVRAAWQRAFATGEDVEYELRIRGPDGTYRWFFTRAVAARDKHGKVTKWYGVTTDIEDRKRSELERERFRALEAELAHVNRVSTMGELTASLAHEITQPITAIVSNASAAVRWLERDQPDCAGACRSAKRILEDSARAAEIIDRVRSLYKKAPPRREPFELNASVRDMLALIDDQATRHAVSIRTALAPDLPETTADRVQLQQVLLNLMLNAIEAMNESGGELTLTSELDEAGHLRCSVSDTGVGLPPDHTDQIFTAFFTTKSRGTGMGLAISGSIIESHGGRLWARANKGRGATFLFTLPC